MRHTRLLWLATLAATLGCLLSAAPARADGVVPEVEFHAAGIIAHDIQSGWRKPVIFAAETVLGPHYGPIYIGGAGLSQVNGVGYVVPVVTYVSRGRLFHGFFKGAVLQLGIRQQSFNDGAKGYYFGVGVAK